MNKKYFLSLVIVLASGIDSFAQRCLSKEASNRIVSGIIREKLRYDIPGLIKQNESTSFERHPAGRNIVQSTEVVVSSSQEIESEIHAAINPVNNNNMVCSSNAVDPTATGSIDVPINHLYYSSNFGSGWTRCTFNPLPVQTGMTIGGGGDPNFAFDKNGRVYTSWINLFFPTGFSAVYWQLLWAYSDDGGVTWNRGATPTISKTSGPFSALFDPSLFNGPISDKEWLAVDRSDSLYQNNLYCAFFEAGGPSGISAISVRKKTAGSNAFDSTSVYITDSTFLFTQFSSIDVDNIGHVHVTFFGSTDSVNFNLYHAVSVDGGNTFSAPNIISALQEYNFSPGQANQTITGIDVQRVYPSAYLAADHTTGLPSSGNLYMTWSADGVSSQGTNGADVFYSRSTNGGLTWSPAVPLNNTLPSDNTDQYYPCLNVNPNGVVVVCWYDRRNYPGTENTDYYMAFSTDGGVTFNNDTVVSNMPTDFTTVGSQNSNFGIGEYNTVLSTADYAIPFWSDGRSNNGDMNIYMATMPLNPNVGIKQLSQVNAKITMSDPYPNPSDGKGSFTLTTAGEEKVNVSLYDRSGRWMKKIFDGCVDNSCSVNFDISSLAAGNYSVVVRSTSGTIIRTIEKLN